VERTIPWSWYADPDVLRREGARIFARSWQYAGHAGQVPEPGSFFASAAGQIPVVVTRARDGELRAFLNVCGHRGHVLATGADRRELGLHEIAVDRWGPFVFVHPDPNAPPLADTLGDVPARVAEIVDVDALEFRFRSEFEVEANWKVACENFLECYHCAVAHPGFAAAVDISPDAYRLESSGLTSSQLGPLRQNGSSFLANGEIPHSQFHFVWPNFGINIFPGRTNLSCGPMLPLGPERTARFLDYFFAPDVDQAWIDDLIAFDTQVGNEDTELVTNVQRGVRAGLLPGGRLLSESEQLVVHFQRLCSEALAE
jgi:phenylpropionate dioxygenase-like ring-hydroxylating dioxygenase large terminal subunit